MDESNEVETVELTEAQVHEIHKHGSGQFPHGCRCEKCVPLTYSGQQAKQYLEAANEKRDAIRAEIGEKLRIALPKAVIPRYLRRAVWSKDPVKIHKAIGRAKAEGWTNEEMVRQVKLINEDNQLNKEYEVQEGN